MKPTEKQIMVCDIIKDQLSFWKSTNDLSSPTHSCDISETLQEEDRLTEMQKDELDVLLTDLLCFVRSICEK